MSAHVQTYVALAIVLATVAWMVRRFLGGKKKPGCGGDCACPASEFKDKLNRCLDFPHGHHPVIRTYLSTMKILSSLVIPLLLAVNLAQAESSFPAKPLVVGESAPDVMLRDEQDRPVPLRELVRRKPTVLVFYRGGWCPFCTRHLAALAEAEPGLTAAGFQLLAISPDQPEKLRAKPTHAKLPYLLLSDSEMNAAKAFGVAFKVEDALVTKYKESYKIDLEGDSGQTHHLLPHPAVFIMDLGGVIRFAHVNPDYKVRLTAAEIMQALRSVP